MSWNDITTPDNSPELLAAPIWFEDMMLNVHLGMGWGLGVSVRNNGGIYRLGCFGWMSVEAEIIRFASARSSLFMDVNRFSIQISACVDFESCCYGYAAYVRFIFF